MNKGRRLRILLITRNLPPLVGGMERLNWHMAAESARAADIRAIGPQGSAELAPPGVIVREAPVRPLWKFLWRAFTLARREAREWNPDIILAGSGLTAPLALYAASVCGAKTAVYVHGLDITVQHVIYRALWLSSIRRMDRVFANSRATAALCRGIGVDSVLISVLHPGVELPAALADELAVEEFRRRHELGRRPLLLSVGRLSTRKGLREFVERTLPMIVAAQPDILLLVVGSVPNNALHAQAQTPQSIRETATRAGVARNLKFLGIIPDAELAVAYRAARVHVFPIREIPGDPEGFGMVAIEAAAHGLPTVAFAVGGVTDAVADGISGWLVAAGDYAAMASRIQEILAGCETDGWWAGSRQFAEQFCWESFGEKLRSGIHDMCPDWREPQHG